MFLRCKVRRKDGKQHRYWSVVENTRVAGGRVVHRHVLYLGEINDSQELAWRRSIDVLEDGAAQPRTLSQMIDVHLPTTDGRELVLTRYTEPEPELRLLLQKLKLELPAQPPPRITAAPVPPTPL
jgi:hypothetical protein